MTSPTSDAQAPHDAAGGKDIGRLLKIRVPVIAVLAQKQTKLQEVLNLNIGSIIQLNKPSEDLLDLMVNDRRVGRGETVRIGDNFGLQLVEIGTLQDTIRTLGGDEEPAEGESEEEPATEEPADAEG